MSLSLESFSLPKLMHSTAERFGHLIAGSPGIVKLPPPPSPPHPENLRWTNIVYGGSLLRRAHLEIFEIADHFAVLHLCIFPHLNDRTAIFGFDMVGGHSQATGIFLDFSSVTDGPPVPALGDAVPAAERNNFTMKRQLPDWGSIFSQDALAIRPAGPGEVHSALALAHRALAYYLESLTDPQGDQVRESQVIDGQAAYARAQRMNPHTFRMLARFVGHAAARRFIDDVLFPLPGEPQDVLF